MTLESASRTSSWSTMRLSLAADLSRFPPIVSFDEQLGVLRVTGDEDRTTSGRRRRPLSAAFKATRDVIVDLSELTLRRPVADDRPRRASPSACARTGRTLSLRHPQPHIRQLIELVGLHRLPSVLVIAPAAGRPRRLAALDLAAR